MCISVLTRCAASCDCTIECTAKTPRHIRSGVAPLLASNDLVMQRKLAVHCAEERERARLRQLEVEAQRQRDREEQERVRAEAERERLRIEAEQVRDHISHVLRFTARALRFCWLA